MLVCFFAGAMVGGAISGLPFGMEGFHVGNLVFCMISKVLLMAVFAGIYVLMGVIGKQRLWLTILLSLLAARLCWIVSTFCKRGRKDETDTLRTVVPLSDKRL